MSFDPMIAPPLYQEKPGVDMPIETIGTSDKTAYLNIELNVNPRGGGVKALPMTAVFAPNPAQLTGEVNVLLWFHGDKEYWQTNRQNGHNFSGKSIQYYLNGPPMVRLRKFILETNKNFLLVAPTLNDKTGGGLGLPAGLLWEQADARAYLQQALNGANKHLGMNGTKLGNIVLAAHSGGGRIQARMAGSFDSEPFHRMNEVWCFDSTYWGADGLRKWAEKVHNNARLFVYSLGGGTAQAAKDLLELIRPTFVNFRDVIGKRGAAVPIAVRRRQGEEAFATVMRTLDPSQPTPPPPPSSQPKPNFRDVIGKRGAEVPVGVLQRQRDEAFRTVARTLTKIEVLLENDRDNAINPAWAAYGGGAAGHYECIEKYLACLVGQSQNL